MTGRIISGALVGALILFVAGFLWYGLLGIGDKPFAQLPNEDAVVGTLVDGQLTSGTYIYPRMDRSGGATSMEEWTALHEKGPLFEIRYHAGGESVGTAGMFVAGFVHFLIATLIIAMLMRMALPSLGSYGRRLMFVTMLGVFAAVFIQPSGPIWFYYPWDRAISDLAYGIISAFLAGLGMAAIIKPAVSIASDGTLRRQERDAVTA